MAAMSATSILGMLRHCTYLQSTISWLTIYLCLPLW
ncbi:hypothetical protein MLGJGCBP_03608 [Rhodococcus sp. T7]|nr:hypothetical protein MLGJGCBP_09458 [Rhodococcus sp. T7]KAF0963302.1 hypothetical protein MLGJGCBP_03608 [Rhodococcus sp. T7]